MDSRWYKKAASRESPDLAARRRPSSPRNVRPFVLIGSSVSNASGVKLCVPAYAWYFCSFLLAAPSAAPPATFEVMVKYEFANVSDTVTSHVMHWPSCQGICFRPSGRSPSDLCRPVGSLTDGTSARTRARQMRSLGHWWRSAARIGRRCAYMHAKLWMLRESTQGPHGQMCGSHGFAPRSKPTAILTALSSNLSPQDEIDRTWSQSPLCGARSASSRSWSRLSGKPLITLQKSADTHGLSHSRCFAAASLSGRMMPVELYRASQCASTVSSTLSDCALQLARMRSWSWRMPAADYYYYYYYYYWCLSQYYCEGIIATVVVCLYVCMWPKWTCPHCLLESDAILHEGGVPIREMRRQSISPKFERFWELWRF
jgi:hypothetical protein